MIKSGENAASEVKADTCFVVRERTDYIVWQKDAFLNCTKERSNLYQ